MVAFSKLAIAIILILISTSSILPAAKTQKFDTRPSKGPISMTPAFDSNSNTSSDGGAIDDSKVLGMNMQENVTLPGGDRAAPVSVNMTFPSGPLADFFREMFGVSDRKVAMDNLTAYASSSTSQGSILDLVNSVETRQLSSLGLITDFSTVYIVPLTSAKGFGVSLEGSAVWDAQIIPGDSSDTLRAHVGYRGPEATRASTQNVLSSLMFTQWLLQNVTGKSEYMSTWDTRIKLPPDATILNALEFADLNWTVVFGGGSYLTASAEVIDASSVDLKEVMVVTRKNISATPDSIVPSLSSYKTFDIDYLIPHSLDTVGFRTMVVAPSATTSQSCDFPSCVSWEFTASASPDISHDFPNFVVPVNEICTTGNVQTCVTNGFSISITPRMSASLKIHLGWDVGKNFDSWFQVNVSSTVKFDVLTQGGISGQASTPLLGRDGVHIHTFAILFPFPPFGIWIDVRFAANLKFEAGIEGLLRFKGGVSLSDTFKAGLDWTPPPSDCEPSTDPAFCTGWLPILTHQASATAIDPTLSASGDATVKVSLPLRLKAYIYSVGGPFVELAPYVRGKITPGDNGSLNWALDLGLEINAGVDFPDIIRDTLHLQAIAINICPGPDPNLPGLSCPIPWPDPFIRLGSGSLTSTPTFSVSVSTPSTIVSPNQSFVIEGEALTTKGDPVDGAATLVVVVGPDCAFPFVCTLIPTVTNGTGGFSAVIKAPSTPGVYIAGAEVSATVDNFTLSAADSFILVVNPPDDTPPQIEPDIFLGASSNGWNDGNVTVFWSTLDPESGVAFSSGCETTIFTNETDGTTLTCIVTNGAGLTSSASVTVRIDKTPPSIAASIFPSPNSSGWNNTPVTVGFICEDALSGVNSTSVTPPFYVPEPRTVTGSCADNAGNPASTTIAIKIDSVPPKITASSIPGPNSNGWSMTDVIVHFDCNDNLSGIASCTNDIVVSTEGRGLSVTGFAEDFAGNRASITLDNINIDKTPPLITSVQDGQAFILHQTVFANAQCSDALSGLDTCAVPGGPLDTSTVGRHSYTVSATDNAGTSAVLVVRYQVHYNFISVSPQAAGKGTQIGRTIPVRFQVTDALGNSIPNVTAQIWVDSMTNPAKSLGSANSANYFRYDVTGNQYLFNLSTSGMTAGSHTLYITLDDGTVHTMTFMLTS